MTDPVVIKDIHLTQRMVVFAPKYSAQYSSYGEPVALLHERKLRFGTSPYVIVEFPKAKSLEAQRFAIKRTDALKHELGTNGAAPMRIIPMSHFSPYLSKEEDDRQTRETLAVFKQEGWI